MSPTPVTFSSPNAPASYSWEATNEEVAARYGVPLESIVRFDLNTSPTPPALVKRLLAAGEFDAPLSEYPPSDYRRLVEAAARRYGVATDEILVGAGADEILDLVAKAFMRGPGRRSPPDLRHVPGQHRAARRDGRRGPAARRRGRLGAGLARPSGRRPGRRPSSGCAARTTRRPSPSPTGRSPELLGGLADDAEPTAARRRSSSSTRPTPSSSARRSSDSATAIPT